MMASYWWRLAWLALACFFIIHLAASAAVALLARRAVQLAGRLQARSAARALFLLRMSPAAFSILAVASICIPSYLWLEPGSAHEQVGWICLAAAMLAVLLWLDSASRFVRIMVRSNRHMRRWRREARPARLGETAAPAYVIPSDVPFLALAGILQPRLIASCGLLRALSCAQLTAAVRHEQAHRTSHDNLKRLILHCMPGLLPFRAGFDVIEQAWAKFAECAADDRAVSGDPARALRLAEALVRVARIQAPQSALVAPLLADRSELHARVDRLLSAAPAPPLAGRLHLLAPAVLMLLIASLLAPAALRLAHQLLEKLIR
jgi:beta-lactamase regulating signal transducer with metallopeptidase domain